MSNAKWGTHSGEIKNLNYTEMQVEEKNTNKSKSNIPLKQLTVSMVIHTGYTFPADSLGNLATPTQLHGVGQLLPGLGHIVGEPETQDIHEDFVGSQRVVVTCPVVSPRPMPSSLALAGEKSLFFRNFRTESSSNSF